MKLKENELKVFYSTEGVHTALDEALEECLKGFGYRRWASGTNMTTDVRDLSFTKEEK